MEERVVGSLREYDLSLCRLLCWCKYQEGGDFVMTDWGTTMLQDVYRLFFVVSLPSLFLLLFSLPLW